MRSTQSKRFLFLVSVATVAALAFSFLVVGV